MMIKIKITACCIILLSFIFFLYPVEAQSMVSPDSENISDSTEFTISRENTGFNSVP